LKRPEAPLDEVDLGGLTVKLIADYEAVAVQIPQDTQRTESVSWTAGKGLEASV
jgi:hypothetical protein